MGHETLLLMRSGLDRVRDIVGDTAAHDLSAHWHLIGWKGTQDEYYAAKAQQVRAMMGERVNPETKLGLERTWQH
jgi:hypothetical protein